MREKRFFVSSDDVKGNTALLSAQESHHLKNVLRLKKGDQVIVFNGEGQEYEGTVSTLSSRVGIQLEKKRRTRKQDAVAICLAQSLPKKKKMDFIISKSCELGVAEIYPLETERSAFKLTGPAAVKVTERWQNLAVQTSKQSHLDWIPKLHKPVKLKEVLTSADEFAAVLLPHTDADLPKLSDIINACKTKLKIRPDDKVEKPHRILLVIGPEGGFSDKEIAMAKENGAHLVYLGDLVLKTETAAVVGIALVKYAFNL